MVSGLISSEFVLPNISAISECFNISAAISGVTFIAVGNTLPDLIGNVVALRSPGSEGIALGNVFGGVMFSTMITFGMLSIILAGNKVKAGVLFSLAYTVVAIVAVLFILFDMQIAWMEAVILFLLYLIYVVSVYFIERRQEKEGMAAADSNDQPLAKQLKSVDHLMNSHKHDKHLLKSMQILESLFLVQFPKCLRMSLDSLLLGWRTLSLFSSSNYASNVEKRNRSNISEMKIEIGNDAPCDPPGSSVEYCPCCRQVGTDGGFMKLLKYHFFPIFSTWNLHGGFGKILGVITCLPRFAFSLVTIVIGPSAVGVRHLKQGDASSKLWPHMYITLFQALVGPLFLVSAAHEPLLNLSDLFGANEGIYFPSWILAVLAGVLFAGAVFGLSKIDATKQFLRWLSVPGLCVSLTWAYLTSMETIGILKAIGLVVGLPDEVLGLTLLVFGNNFGDLTSAWIATKVGMNEMAVSAAAGQPVLVLLFNMAIIIFFMPAISYEGTVIMKTTVFVVIAIGVVTCWITGSLFFYAANGGLLSRKHGIFGIIIYFVCIISILITHCVS